MFKKIPGSTKYRINLQQDVIDVDGNVVDLQPVAGIATVELFGTVMDIDVRRLSLLAWYEAGAIDDLRSHLDKIVFKPVDSRILRVECGMLMTFKEPILFGSGFRIIPSFPHYAISLEGRVVDTRTNSSIEQVIDSDGYVSVFIRNPDKGKNKTVRVHRLMALAWLPNDDFLTRPFVNHMDGRKENYRLDNLEWCSLSENAQHALETGLTNTCVKMKSRDRLTGEIVFYRSGAEMSKKLGTTSSAASNYLNKLPGFLHRGRYEIKSQDDETPWYYEELTHDWKDGDPVKAIYSIRVLDKVTGELLTFTNVKKFCRAFKIKLNSINIEKAAEVFKDLYPSHELTITRNATRGPYQVIDLTSKKTIVVNSIQHAAEITGINRSGLQFDLCRGRKFIYVNRWMVVPGLGKVDRDQYVDKVSKHKRVLATHDGSGQTKQLHSAKEAARFSGLDYKSVDKSIRTGRIIKGWIFRALDQ